MTERLDTLIDEIRSKYHKEVTGKPKGEGVSGDVLVVAHGHILRAFAMRWINQELANGVTLLLDGTSPFSPQITPRTNPRTTTAGGVGTLRYPPFPPIVSLH